MKFPARIDVKSDVMMGKPCVKGTRIPVYLLLEKMAAGESFDQLLSAYPQLAPQDLLACLEYAAALAADEIVPDRSVKFLLDENLSPPSCGGSPAVGTRCRVRG